MILQVLFLIGGCPIFQNATSVLGDIHVEYCFDSLPSPRIPNVLRIRLSEDTAKLVTGLIVDARMPEHQHGLLHPVTVKRTSQKEWSVSDLVLHMPGRWVISLDFAYGGDYRRVRIPLNLKFR